MIFVTDYCTRVFLNVQSDNLIKPTWSWWMGALCRLMINKTKLWIVFFCCLSFTHKWIVIIPPDNNIYCSVKNLLEQAKKNKSTFNQAAWPVIWTLPKSNGSHCSVITRHAHARRHVIFYSKYIHSHETHIWDITVNIIIIIIWGGKAERKRRFGQKQNKTYRLEILPPIQCPQSTTTNKEASRLKGKVVALWFRDTYRPKREAHFPAPENLS